MTKRGRFRCLLAAALIFAALLVLLAFVDSPMSPAVAVVFSIGIGVGLTLIGGSVALS